MSKLVTPEKIAYWYLRLNGFMTMENFILHNESPRGLPQRTDADIYGVRFPFRKELDISDDELFWLKPEKPLFVIAEIKAGECKLNGPWTDPLSGNMEYVLKGIGNFEPSMVNIVAKALYQKYVYEDEKQKIQLFVIGSRLNEDYARERPALSQLLFADILTFIYERFNCFWLQKRNNQQWDPVGRFLYESAGQKRADFVSQVLGAAGLLTAQ